MCALIDGSGDGASAALAIQQIHNETLDHFAKIGSNIEAKRPTDRSRVALQPWLWRAQSQTPEEVAQRKPAWTTELVELAGGKPFNHINDLVGIVCFVLRRDCDTEHALCARLTC